jgi:hypothetical protein
MIAVGVGGAIGTYANAKSQLGQSETAIGVVAAGEGAVLVASLVMIGVTMLGQAAPLVVRAALWLLPATASAMGLAIAPGLREAVIYALTPLAMTASAEGISFLARRIVSHTSGVDVEAQRRNADLVRQIAYHRARAERHPDKKVRAQSALKAWELMSRIGQGDAELGSGLITVQRDRLTEGANTALLAMLTGSPEPVPVMPVSRALEPGEPGELGVETAGEPLALPAILSPRTAPAHEPHPSPLNLRKPIIDPSDQPICREPVLSQAETPLTRPTQTAAETPTPTPAEPHHGMTSEPEPESSTREPEGGEPEPGTDEKEQQVLILAQRLRSGEQLTKTVAAQILNVSPATAGRRLKEARDRISEGTGFYV